MFSKFKLPNQLPGENPVKILRRDLFILFKKVVLVFLMLLAPVLIYVFLINVFPVIWENQFLYAVLVLAGSVYFLSVWLFAFFYFIDYYLDVWIVTNRRIISIEQKGFFSRTVSELKLFRIQDVTVDTEGVFPTLLNYGSVYVQTAGSKRNFHFEQVPDPENTKDEIINLIRKDRKRKEIEKEKLKTQSNTSIIK